jgi:hypothetical protein
VIGVVKTIIFLSDIAARPCPPRCIHWLRIPVPRSNGAPRYTLHVASAATAQTVLVLLWFFLDDRTNVNLVFISAFIVVSEACLFSLSLRRRAWSFFQSFCSCRVHRPKKSAHIETWLKTHKIVATTISGLEKAARDFQKSPPAPLQVSGDLPLCLPACPPASLSSCLLTSMR